MKQSSAGSQSSPIIISDDEDDSESVSGHLLQLDTPSSSSSVRMVPHFPSPKKAPRNRARNVEKRNSATKNSISGVESSKSRKRKREQSNTRLNASGSNQTTSMSSAIGNGSVSKNKRAKQQERASRFQRENNARRLIYEEDALEQSSDSLTTTFPSIYSIDSPIPSDFLNDGLSMDANQSSLSSSEWVNSMARAAEPPNSIQSPSSYSWEYSAPTAFWISSPQTYTADHPNTAPSVQPPSSAPASLPPKPVTSTTSNSTINSLPKKPTSTNTIGMPKERDLDGKRGGFKVSHSTVFDSQSHVTYPHTPDPSCTLIIEQLPKSCRSPQWIKSWAKSACGSQLVFYAIDSSSAKALLEFPSVVSAEKAWRSPKLGKGIASLSPTELKGKSREDLIRAWWYRPPSPEVVFTRKELEEGEIEDEDDLIDGRKESKKEKKARLAKLAKEEKAKKKENAQAAAAALAKEKQAQSMATSVAPTSSNGSLAYSSAATDVTGAISTSPSLQTAYTPNPYSGGLPILWSSATGISSFTPTLPPGPLVSSQYELHAQWREPHPIASPEPPPLTQFSLSLSMNGSSGDRAHVAESALDHEDNMDLDEVDMEIASPTVLASAAVDVPVLPTIQESSTSMYSMHSDSISLPSTNTLSVTSELSAPVPTVGQPTIPLLSSQPVASHRGLPTPIPTPPNLMPHAQDTAISGSGSSTPLPTPSEPRAMKNAPREPTFTKRNLLARQKELEERIARTKMELQRSAKASYADTIMTGSSTIPVADQEKSTPLSSAVSAPASSYITHEGSPEINSTKQEDDLRRRVVMSQKKRHTATVTDVSTPVVSSAINGSLQADPLADSTALSASSVPPANAAAKQDFTEDSTGDFNSRTPSSSTATTGSALDDLAVSFIQESIQTIKPASPSASPPVQVPEPKRPVLQTQVGKSSVGLAARRKQLENQIAETKRLMNLLAAAGTKRERDDIMSKIRTISRAVAAGDSQSPISSETPAPSPVPAPKYPSFLVQSVGPGRRLWPDSVIDGGILILSDDEDEDEED